MNPACIHCDKEIPEGFTTCSPDCTTAFRNGDAPPGEAWDTPPAGKFLATTEQVAHHFGVSKVTIHSWVARGKLPRHAYYRLGPRKTQFDLDALKKEMGNGRGLGQVQQAEPLAVVAGDTARAGDIGGLLQVEAYRARGLAAAKQAFRDVMLEGADDAKARGDFKLQARFLEDYLFFEEGLKLSYVGRHLSP